MARKIRLRDVHLGDVDTYIQMRCDPVMMAELGGAQPADEIPAKVARDAADAAAGRAWVSMIITGESAVTESADEMSADVAGSVVLWSHDDRGVEISEIGWMVLPQFQGQGIGKAAVRQLLERARDERRWGLVHAFPAQTNAASNGICRSLGFTELGRRDIDYHGVRLRTVHWSIDPAGALAPS